MSILDIVFAPSAILNKTADKVNNVDKSIKSLVHNMFDTMYENNGVGLAAPQINKSLQILVIDCSNKDNLHKPIVLINPSIITQSEDFKLYEEGCLSFPDQYFEVSRPEFVKVNFLDIDGQSKEKIFNGFEAVCVQHEIDHLVGTLFTSYISRLKRQIVMKKMQKFKKNLNKPI